MKPKITISLSDYERLKERIRGLEKDLKDKKNPDYDTSFYHYFDLVTCGIVHIKHWYEGDDDFKKQMAKKYEDLLINNNPDTIKAKFTSPDRSGLNIEIL